MHPRDKEKTTFMRAKANYYYEVMSFELKNARATYQRLMDKIFKGLIGRAVEVYVDDIVVKSNYFEQHLKDLDEVFKALRGVNMKLNPEKCTFGVEGGKFLGFMLTVWRSIVCRFGVPHTIITDNGRQFIDRGLESFYDDLASSLLWPR